MSLPNWVGLGEPLPTRTKKSGVAVNGFRLGHRSGEAVRMVVLRERPTFQPQNTSVSDTQTCPQECLPYPAIDSSLPRAFS